MTSEIDKLQKSVVGSLRLLSNPETSQVFGKNVKSVDKSVKQIAWKAKKLEISKDRNAAISVYGPSQVGKSFLASVLVRPTDKYLEIDFPKPVGKKIYIDEINPGGDQECTGLVTRFTLNSGHQNEKFPVYLRLLTEIDLVCILVNSYFSDGDQRHEVHKTAEEISEFIQKIDSDNLSSNVCEEDFWEFEEYIKEQFYSYDYAKTLTPFVELIANKAMQVGVEKRAQLYSPFWGFHKEFTNLFVKLANELSELGSARELYADISALIPKSTSIIDVSLLGEIFSDDAGRIDVCLPDGKVSSISRGILSAITAELVLNVSQVPHKFFNHTDVLDFPGTRNRKADDLKNVFDGFSKGENNIHQFLLRGKVAYLFDKYVNSQDINSMLLCIKDSNMEAVGLPSMIEKWVQNSIGVTPADRRNRDNNLFFVMTYFDKHLSDTAANHRETDRFTRRLKASLLEMFGNHQNTWPLNWDGSDASPKSFKNCYWLRNPGIAQSFYEFDKVTGLEKYAATNDQQRRLDEIKNMFMGTPEVSAHFKDPKKAWNAVMQENDGGTSYILENLSGICKPNTKINQLNALANNLSDDLYGILYDFYIPTDNAEKERVNKQKFEALKNQIMDASGVLNGHRFSSFLDQIGINGQVLSARLGDLRAHDLPEFIGNICETWADHAKSISTQVSKEFGLSKTSVDFLIHELSLAMALAGLKHKIIEKVSFLEFQGLNRGTKALSIEIGVFMLNEFIAQRFIMTEDRSGPLSLPVVRPNLEKNFVNDWLKMLEGRILENVSSNDGDRINQEANRLLEEIISELKK
jgi:hypothetical protein